MKFAKLFTVLLALCFSVSNTFSQFEDISDHYISVGYGYSLINADVLFEAYNFENDYNSSDFGPVSIQYEGIFQDKIGFGIELAYSKASSTWLGFDENDELNDNFDISRRKLSGVARANYRLGLGKIIDPYGSFGMGYKINHWKLETDSPGFSDADFVNLNTFALLARIGVRIMFVENVGAYIEAGAGHGIVMGGLTVKL